MIWFSPATGVGPADGLSVGTEVLGSGPEVGRRARHAIFVQPRAPLEQKQLLQWLCPVSFPDQPLSTVPPPDKVHLFGAVTLVDWNVS